MKLWNGISRLIINRPIKVVGVFIALLLLLGAGITNIKMATGNETLLEESSQIFQENVSLESEFGGESIIVLYKTDKNADLLALSNFEHMKGIQDSLQGDDVFGVVSPVTIVEHMSKKQAEKYRKGILEISKGLDEMGSKLIQIGTGLNENSTKQQTFPDPEKSFAELNRGMEQLIAGQEKLKEGTSSLIGGYSQFGGQTKQVAQNIFILSEQLEKEASNPKQIQEIQKLKQLSRQSMVLSDKMLEASRSASPLPGISDKTINGLKKIEGGLGNQQKRLNEIKNNQKNQQSQLKEMGKGLAEMGNSLVSISENLAVMEKHADSQAPSLPQKQETLDQMLYEEDGGLKSIFNELVIDGKYMILTVKVKGNTSDELKSEIVHQIKEYLEKHPLENTEVIVSGKPVLDDAIRASMKESMKKMMMLSIVLMVVVLSAVFKVRWRIMPLAAIMIAVAGTVGIMGWLNIPVTMVSMAVFPILIGLGIDYAIQFQSRYTEELGKGVIHGEE